MSYFPVLKTGAEAQYGIERLQDCPVTVQRFLDGRTRRFAQERTRRIWRLRLSELSAQEAERINTFAGDHFETGEPFIFRDPWTGEDYPGCEIRGGQIQIRADGEHKYHVQLLIEQRQV